MISCSFFFTTDCRSKNFGPTKHIKFTQPRKPKLTQNTFQKFLGKNLPHPQLNNNNLALDWSRNLCSLPTRQTMPASNTLNKKTNSNSLSQKTISRRELPAEKSWYLSSGSAADWGLTPLARGTLIGDLGPVIAQTEPP